MFQRRSSEALELSVTWYILKKLQQRLSHTCNQFHLSKRQRLLTASQTWLVSFAFRHQCCSLPLCMVKQTRHVHFRVCSTQAQQAQQKCMWENCTYLHFANCQQALCCSMLQCAVLLKSAANCCSKSPEFLHCCVKADHNTS